MRVTFFLMLLVFFAVSVGGGIFLKNSFDRGSLQQVIVNRAMPNESATTTAMIERALGMEGKRTYLLLFLNNTELRPGGGFIGSYGVVSVEKGKPQIIKIEGTESLDNASAEKGLEPYPPLTKYLGIKKLQLRDSNWSPDFSVNAKLAIQLYRDEGGVSAADLEGVIAVTPTLFEEILKITGPVKVGDIEFTSDNFTEKLEYEVEYGYKYRGKDFSERKDLLSELSTALMPKILASGLTHWKDYLKLVPKMLSEKQIMLYSIYEDERQYLADQRWDGKLYETDGDYLMWTDANLGALKTDVAIQRSLSYSVGVSSTGKYVATSVMKYNHTGGFTWRTTRYRNYVRIFVPKGSKIIRARGGDTPAAEKKLLTIDEGDEGNYHWFGTFISIEPGRQGKLIFEYELSDKIAEKIKNSEYSLFVQKQPGTPGNRLTLSLSFDKKLVSASPAESSEKFGDARYEIVSILGVDRYFQVNLAK